MSTTAPKQSRLKNWFLFGLGFGSGAILILAIIVGGIAWYLNLPKPWNDAAMKASFSQEIYSLLDKDFNLSGMELEYFEPLAAFAVITEATKEDYTISPSDTFM